jgi:hypothetical protein
MGLICGMQKKDVNAWRRFVGKLEEMILLERLGLNREGNESS